LAPPKKRYEHIHVRLAVAVLGHRHFWEGPTPLFFGQDSYIEGTQLPEPNGLTRTISLGSRVSAPTRAMNMANPVNNPK